MDHHHEGDKHILARVNRICSFAGSYFATDAPSQLLDVGSGLAVFPYAMRLRGWNCTALDPDPRAVEHARNIAGVTGICANFLKDRIKERFPLI